MQPDVSDAPTQFMIDGARVVASKPIDDLVRVHAMYLWLVEHRGAPVVVVQDGGGTLQVGVFGIGALESSRRTEAGSRRGIERMMG